VRLDETRLALVLTREAARAAMTRVTLAFITTTIKGLSSKVPVGPDNGLDHDCVVALDNVLSIPWKLLGAHRRFPRCRKEASTGPCCVLAYHLGIPLLE
jgi:mRNA interferase MazF